MKKEAQLELDIEIVQTPSVVAYMRKLLTNSGVKWNNRNTAKRLAYYISDLMKSTFDQSTQSFVKRYGDRAYSDQVAADGYTSKFLSDWKKTIKQVGVNPTVIKDVGFSFQTVCEAIKNVSESLEPSNKSETLNFDWSKLFDKAKDLYGTGKVSDVANRIMDGIRRDQRNKAIREVMPMFVGGALLLVLITFLIARK